MKVLVIHDRAEVATRIASVVTSFCRDAVDLEIVDDGRKARLALSKNTYDLVIIDLTLPHIQGRDAPTFSTADQLLVELFEHDGLNIPGDIIGISREPSMLGMVANTIGPHVMVVIEEDAGGQWERYLAEKLRYAYNAANARQFSLMSQYDLDLLLITALDKELEPLIDIFSMEESTVLPACRTFGFHDRHHTLRRGVAFAIGKSGEARCASYAQSLITLFRPRVVGMSGICGGVPEKTKIGDLVIAESALDWDYGKWETPETAAGEPAPMPRFVSRPSPISISGSSVHLAIRRLVESRFNEDAAFTQAVRRWTEGRVPTVEVHLAAMGSGSAVIGHEGILAQVRALNDETRGVDMECFGLYFASRNTFAAKPQAFCIKSVSDFADGTKGDAFHRDCAYISAISTASLIREFIEYEHLTESA